MLVEAGSGKSFEVQLAGVDRLKVDGFNQHNIVAELRHWTQTGPWDGLKDAALWLALEEHQGDIEPHHEGAALGLAERVKGGELEIMEISAIYGAEIVASFASLSLVEVE